MRGKLLAVGVVVAASAWLLWPLLTCGGCIVDFERSFAADPVTGQLAAPDTRLNIWILWWVQHALLHAPFSLFDGNVFWPAERVLAGSEHMLALAVLTLPLRLVTDDAVVVYTGAILLTSLLTGLSAYALVRWLTYDRAASLVAAAVAVLMPWRTSEIVHLQLLSAGLIPLVWLYSARVLTEPSSRRTTLVLAALWAIQLFSSYYVAFFALFSTAALVAVVMVTAGSRRDRVARLTVATAVPALALAAMSVVYLRTQGSEAVALRGAMPRSLAPAWVLGQLVPERLLGAGSGPWQRGYEIPSIVLGLAVVGLATASFARLRARDVSTDEPTRARLVLVDGLVAAIVVGFVMSIGWAVSIGGLAIPLPARFASALVPGFANLRGSLRWTLVLGAAVPVLAGIGVAALRGIASRAGATVAVGVTAACAALLLVDLRPPRLAVAPAYAARTAETPGLRALAKLPPGPVLDVPWPQNLVTNAVVSSEYMLASTVHEKPILAGYTAYAPRSYDLVLRAARNLPRPDAVRRLAALTGLRWIVVHESALDEAERAAWQAAAAQVPFITAYSDDALTIYEVVGTTVDPRVLAAVRSATPGATTVLGLPRGALTLDSASGVFQAAVPAALPGYADDWMKSAVGVHVENRSAVAWPGLDGSREGLVLVRYRLLAANGDVALDGLSDLDADVPAGQTLDSFVVIEGHVPPGDYRLELSVVQQIGTKVVPLPFPSVVGPTRVAAAR